MTDEAKKLLAALQAKGVETDDLRYAVHEAVHALSAVLKPPWTVARVSSAMTRWRTRGRRAEACANELQARVVETIVCERMGVTIKDIEQRIGISCMESSKFGEAFFSYDDALNIAKKKLANPGADDVRLVAKILAFAEAASASSCPSATRKTSSRRQTSADASTSRSARRVTRG